MSSLVIVAIPEKDDYVWKISSEKVPHLSILYLGEATENPKVTKIVEFLEHAAKTVLAPFWLDVSERDTLGKDEADVVFFEGSWDLPVLKEFRSALLKDNNIRMAYDSAEQYPEWQPHLTLGYPDTPAKPDNRDYPGIHSVRFDRIALWYGDFEGPEFKLKPKYLDYPLEVAMSSMDDAGRSAVSDILSHHGVKGMRWGVRRKNVGTAQEVVVTDKGRKLKAKGGKGHEAAPEAVKAATLNQQAKKSGVKSLSNEELQTLATRMNLEQQVTRLNNSQPGNPGRKFVKKLLGDVAKQQATRIANDQAAKQVDKMMANKADKTKKK